MAAGRERAGAVTQRGRGEGRRGRLSAAAILGAEGLRGGAAGRALRAPALLPGRTKVNILILSPTALSVRSPRGADS